MFTSSHYARLFLMTNTENQHCLYMFICICMRLRMCIRALCLHLWPFSAPDSTLSWSQFSSRRLYVPVQFLMPCDSADIHLCTNCCLCRVCMRLLLLHVCANASSPYIHTDMHTYLHTYTCRSSQFVCPQHCAHLTPRPGDNPSIALLGVPTVVR